MKLSFITINYNGTDDTIRLASSFHSQLGDWNLIIVDNASRIEEYNKLKSSVGGLDRVALVRSEENTGFSGGNNLGISEAGKHNPDWYIFVNNDTWLEPDFTERLAASLADKKGVVGIPLKENGKVAYAGKITWFKPTLTHLYDFPENLKGRYAIGAGIAIDRQAAEKLSWDERYFLYFEDADFSERARSCGFLIQAVDKPVIHHQGSVSTRKLGWPALLRYHYRNAHLFNAEHAPWPLKTLLPIWSLLIIMRQLVKLVIAPEKRPYSKAIIAGVLDFYRRKFGQIL
ncbi:MAG: glycosyltransferase family 2 protein [Candidatus Yanofskybacteria bacterium]|nr:glycosyltransferase family 2 protein [Candidatus Yanofskybacteria bacterium]